MFIAYENAIECIRLLKPIIDLVAVHDRDLADQLKRAASSIVLNVGEGRRGRDANARRHFRLASQSARESLACLDVAAAWQYTGEPQLAASRTALDRECALLYPLTR